MNENNFLTKNAALSNLEGSDYELPFDNINYTMNVIDPTEIITKNGTNTTAPILALCSSMPQCIAQGSNTSFSIVPTVLSESNASVFFRYDHTPIQFKDGQRHGNNFECARTIPFDIDNTHSDNPDDWVMPDDIAYRLSELDINFWIVTSRNHLLSKDGKIARPKFHVYLPLLQPLYDKEKFVCYCEWCIKSFNSDPQVKSPAQQIFGYGDNPNAFIEHWGEGRYVDEVLCDNDLDIEVKAPTVQLPILPVDLTERERRAIAYIEKMPVAVQGQNGSSAALNVCNKLFEFGLDKKTAKRIFETHYNPLCRPMWTDKEIDHKLDSAYSKPIKTAGCMLKTSEQNGCERKGTICLKCWADIEDREPSWLWKNKIPGGDLTIISGMGSIGKSYLTCYLASCITNGFNWADGSCCERGNVLFFPPEGQQAAFKRRLQANDVNLNRCHLFEGMTVFDSQTQTEVLDPVILSKSADIEKAIEEIEERTGEPVRAIICDPVGNFAGSSDTYKDTDVRRILTPLQQLADRRNVAIILVAHHGKAEHSSSQNQTAGSIAWVNVPRSVWQVYRDKDDKSLRYFAPSKANDCVEPTTVAFRIVTPSGQGKDHAEGQVQIVSTDIQKHADDFMYEQQEHRQRGRKPAKRDEVKDWLLDSLMKGEKTATEIYEEGAEKGFSESTIDRAKRELRIISKKDGMDGWKWQLQGDGQKQKSSRD